MPIYYVQHKIKVLLTNNVNIDINEPNKAHSFTIEELTFRPWTKNPHDFWQPGEWLVEACFDVNDLRTALGAYAHVMSRVVPRIAFVGQAYINDRRGPIFIKRQDKDFGWLKSIIKEEPVSLDFMDDDYEALSMLLVNKEIPDTFYYYWNDAVNTTGYTGKLLLMFGAIDSLATRGQRRKKRNEILGEKLADEIYADDVGLRNRLTHGDYIDSVPGKNYVELVHKKVLEYFNKTIIDRNLLELNIVGPQRHFDENYAAGVFYVKAADKKILLDLRSLVEDININEGIPRSYEIISDNEIIKNY